MRRHAHGSSWFGSAQSQWGNGRVIVNLHHCRERDRTDPWRPDESERNADVQRGCGNIIAGNRLCVRLVANILLLMSSPVIRIQNYALWEQTSYCEGEIKKRRCLEQ